MPDSNLNIGNRATYEYLQQVARGFPFIPIFPKTALDTLNKKDRQHYEAINEIIQKIRSHPEYLGDFNYQTLYTNLHELAEKLPKDMLTNQHYKPEMQDLHAHLFVRLFENDNKIHDVIHAEVISPGDSDVDHHRIQANLDERTNFKKSGIIPFIFTHPEGPYQRLMGGVLGYADYHPLKRNNIPYISFKHSGPPERKNLRFGAQNNRKDRSNRAFKQFLLAKDYIQKENDRRAGIQAFRPKVYNHVYINLQKVDAGSGGFERKRECARSQALHRIERKYPGIAVISMPADGPSFWGGFNNHSGRAKEGAKPETLNTLKETILEGIKNNCHDFYFSDAVRSTVFSNEDGHYDIDAIVGALFDQAVKDIMGPDYPAEVSPEERQAILFNFVKFHLTDYCLNKLNPGTYNISCKDNIDRGGVHNLWYELNLMLKDDAINEIKQEDFLKHFHASALLVKERPVNDHRKVLWNALYQAYTHNPEKYATKMSWLGNWLKNNVPTNAAEEKALKKPENKRSSKEKAIVANHKQFEATMHDSIKITQRRIQASTLEDATLDRVIVESRARSATLPPHSVSSQSTQRHANSASLSAVAPEFNPTPIRRIANTTTIAPTMSSESAATVQSGVTASAATNSNALEAEGESAHIVTKGNELTLDQIEHFKALCQTTFGSETIDIRKTQDTETVKQYVISDSSDDNKIPDITVTSIKENAQATTTTQDFSMSIEGHAPSIINNGVQAMTMMAIDYAKDNHLNQCEIAAAGNQDIAVYIATEMKKNDIKPVFDAHEFDAQAQAAILARVDTALAHATHRGSLSHDSSQSRMFSLQRHESETQATATRRTEQTEEATERDTARRTRRLGQE